MRIYLKNEERQTSRRKTFVMAMLMIFSINSYSQNTAIEACHTYLFKGKWAITGEIRKTLREAGK